MKSFCLFFCFLFFISGCMVTQYSPLGGGVTVGVKEPFESNFLLSAAPPQVSAEACSYNFFYLISLGDSSLFRAKEKANIKTISFADRIVVHYSIFLYFLTISCTRVTGT